MIVWVTDWNLANRFYEMSKADLKVMMALPRNERKEFFREHTKMARIHCDTEADTYLPIYTDDDWDEHEEDFRKQFDV